MNPVLELHTKSKNLGMHPVSYSQISLFNQCPKRWKLNYIDKVRQFKPSIHLIYGTSMHNVIQNYLTVMYNESAKKANEIVFEKQLQTELYNQYEISLNESVEKKHFSNKQELASFYNDGIQTLNYLKKKRAEYFTIKNWKLIGCEVPLLVPTKVNPKVALYGFIDLILHDVFNDIYKITDLKTSTRGWSKYEKDDPIKRSQVLLYKIFYAIQESIDINKIEVDFLILKRKLQENCEWPQKRIQIFKPPAGTPSLNKTEQILNNFVSFAFDSNGQHDTDKEYQKTDNLNNCKWCEFANTKYCDRKIR